MKKSIGFGMLGASLFSSIVSFADDHKTVADVADKALDAFVSVSNQIKLMAPEIWQTVLKQQYVNVTTAVIEQAVYIVAFVVFVLIARKITVLKQEYNSYAEAEKDRETDVFVTRQVIGLYVPSVVVFIMTCVLIGDVIELSKVYANPEYYAIKSMADMIHK